MADFYEIDFLPVHTSKSGDAIAMRFQIGANWWVHVVDGGYTSTAPDVAAHIRQYYGTNHINRMVVTHPDQDHAEGLAPILEQFTVDELWMLRPWDYADVLVPHFSRYTSAQALRDRLRKDYPYIEALEKIAIRKNIPILEPFQGATIGPFTVLAPSRARYFQLILQSELTPQVTPQTTSILDALMKVAAPMISFIKAGWGSERFSSEETSIENEMSVVQYAFLNGHKIVLTGDAGRGALTEAADYAASAGLFLPGVDRFQVPHHGGRRNVSTELLDRWLRPRLPQILPHGQELFTAMISSAKEDTDHPRKAVIRALFHRGALIGTTEDGTFGVWKDAPRRGWNPLRNPPYPDEQEED
jgi:beta-lactamase superfamily II metal-dependent hydrolase